MTAVDPRLGAYLEYQGATGGSRSMFLVQHDGTRGASIAVVGNGVGKYKINC